MSRNPAFEAHHDAKSAEADKAIEAMLAGPDVRERIEQTLNPVRPEAAAKAEQASRLAEAMQAHYQQATNDLTAELMHCCSPNFRS